ncbi:MAG TPA: prepilin-type N-terminal cleavage/methylation domain-containing protein [Candidatus Baltobacteraceae bacterium]|nr:prepilin-type N-terminal cleavage/methylation domain-containing protein [Candidatus Baltobacteraceae bacterium]
MRSTRTAERGFTLVELVVAVGVLAIAGAATAGAFAAVARNAAPGGVRDAALTVAENALTRARAAVAYAPPSAPDGTPPAPDRSWALVAGTTSYVAGAQLRGPSPCGAASPQTAPGAAPNASSAVTLKLPVTTTFDPSAQRFTVVVTYPSDPCGVPSDGSIPSALQRAVTVSETLPPSAYPPGQTLVRDVAPPARM